VLPPAAALAFYLLLEHLAGGVAARTQRALRLAFLAGLYLFAVSYGMHEPANYVGDRLLVLGNASLIAAAIVYFAFAYATGLLATVLARLV
jgi:hypothetical protein